MSLKWTGSQNESGILRKSDFKEKKEELFVFGYSCKLFREDDRAQLIDQGKHLIPWMGDETLKIDRYDARGALHDLSSLEAPPGGYDWRVELTRAEQDVEQLCDEERYRALHTDEDEEEMYKEEELKRLHAAGYGQVGFNYDAPSDPEPASQPAEVDEPFLPTTTFKALLPPDVVLPDTDKQNAIIEKTAKFIAAQGAQMEILIKAKQRDNSQFQFLNKDSELHPYYIALIALIKAEKWPEKKAEAVEEKPPENEDYLHPSLASTIIESAPSIPSIHYRPSADCDYTLLISKMRGEEGREAGAEEPYAPERAPGEVAPPGTEPLPPRHAHHISRAPVMYRQQGEEHAAQTPMTSQPPPAPAALPISAQYQQHYAAYYHQYMAQNADIAARAQALPTDPPRARPRPSPLKSTGLSLMKNYNTDSDSDVSDCDDGSSSDSKAAAAEASAAAAVAVAVVTPPADVQTVIDKMAAYVARNGAEFADIVRAKRDPRFAFLDPAHLYHQYYALRLRGMAHEHTHANTAAPVSFSIKKLKEPDPILPKPALPYESSEDEDSENKQTDKQADKVEKDTLKSNIPQTYPTNMPPVVVYKIEAPQASNNLPVVKAIETMKTVSKPVPNTTITIPEVQPKKIEIPKEKPIVNQVERIPKIVEVIDSSLSEKRVIKNNDKDGLIKHKRKRKKDHATKDSERGSAEKEKKLDRASEKGGERASEKGSEKVSEKGSERASERGSERASERGSEREKKRKKYSKDDLESEIISLEDNSDDMIDLTGDQSDSKGEESCAERAKQAERRRRAAEFLRRVGVDPAAAALPTSSLASAMVDTLESLRKKKAEAEAKRRKRERRRRGRHGHDDEKLHRKSKHKKYNRSSDDNEDSDYESSKKKKRKKEKKHSSKIKKKKKRETEIGEEEEVMDHPLPPDMDLTTTLKELRTSSPTKELGLQNVEETSQSLPQECSSDEEVNRKRKKKEEREYSEGEWSSDSEEDSGSSPSKNGD